MSNKNFPCGEFNSVADADAKHGINFRQITAESSAGQQDLIQRKNS